MAKEILNGELMNEEELDEVVGGSHGELSCDTKFLYVLGIINHYYEPGYVETHMSEVANEIETALARRGNSHSLKIYTALNNNNTYIYDNK